MRFIISIHSVTEVSVSTFSEVARLAGALQVAHGHAVEADEGLLVHLVRVVEV